MKVYLYRICYDNSIYAFTMNKDYADMFEEQRSMDVFHKEKIHLDDYEWMIFSNTYKSFMIIKDILYDGDNNYEIACTSEESDKLSSSCEHIEDICTMIKNSYMEYLEDLKSIINLTQIITKQKNSLPQLNINTFKLFYHLFKFTFQNTEGGKDYLFYENQGGNL